MRIIAEYIENAMYMDLVLSLKEINSIRDGEMVHSVGLENGQRIYVGVRMDDRFDADEGFWWDDEDW